MDHSHKVFLLALALTGIFVLAVSPGGITGWSFVKTPEFSTVPAFFFLSLLIAGGLLALRKL